MLNLLCPSHDCKTTIPPEILQEVLDTEKLERWERLLLSKTLDVMGDVVFCPRCNVAVVVDEDESSKLGHCGQLPTLHFVQSVMSLGTMGSHVLQMS